MVKPRGGTMAAMRRLVNHGLGRAATYAASRIANAGARYIKSKIRPRIAARKGAYKPRGAGAYNRKPSVIKGNPTGLATLSSTYVPHKASKACASLLKVGTHNTYYDQKTLRVEVDAGFQEYGSLEHATNPLIQTSFAGIPNQGSQPNLRMALKRYQSEVLVSNATNMACEVEIFDLCTKRDFSAIQAYNDPSTTPGGPFTWGNFAQGAPVGALFLGAETNSAALTAIPTVPYVYQFVGSSIRDSDIFNDYFKVVKRVVIQLPQGGCHRHVFTQDLNRIVDRTLLYEQFSNITPAYALQGLTYFTMLRVRGYPVSDNKGTGSSITTASVAIDVVETRRWSYTYVVDNNHSIKAIDNLVSIPLTQQAFVNPGSGLLDVVQQTV